MSISEERSNNRKKFIADFCRMANHNYESLGNVEKAYLELAISECMDAAIKYKDKLDIDYDNGYIL